MDLIKIGGFVIPRDKFTRIEQGHSEGIYYVYFTVTKNGWFSTYEEETYTVVRNVSKEEINSIK